ncbi:MAG TPA: D-glycerate dehydrogenase, partial [Rhodovulum sp.]|nr:D-glycerate dehydrogenase [Rhodovulum sp.]
MTKILVTRPMPGRVGPVVRELGEVEMRDSNLPLSEDEMRRALAEFDIVLPTLGDRFSAGIFAAVDQPRARLLANFGMGYNHIDVAAARALGIAVTNTPGAVTDATADMGMLLILMTCRRGG